MCLHSFGRIANLLIHQQLFRIVNFTTYFGNSFYSIHLGGNAYENYLLSGLVELPALFIAPFLLDKFGRKQSFILASFFNVCCFGLLAFVNHCKFAFKTVCNLFHNPVFLVNRQFFIPIWLLAKFGASATFNFMLVYNSEIFPTIIRNSAMGLCAVCSNLGAAVGSHVFYTVSFTYSNV